MIIKKKIFIILFSFFTLIFARQKFMIFGGKTGWIGKKIVKLLKDQNYEIHLANSRLENKSDLEIEILAINPDFVFNAAGAVGFPNVDWCEDHKQEVIKINIVGALNLADVCFKYNIHMTNFGTGCIYEYDNLHSIANGKGFVEEDLPNVFIEGSVYSKTKAIVDSLFLFYPNVLNLRIRQPISDDLYDPKNFITKISKYKKVINIPNSQTILYDLLPISIEMSLRKLNGNYNFVNPGSISHNEILELYKHFIDPNFKYENFSLEEQNKVLKAKRFNCKLDTTKLLKEFPNIPDIKDSIINVFKRMQTKLITTNNIEKNCKI